MSVKSTRKQYLRLYLDDAYISQHTSVLEAAESASENGPGTYQVRVGSEVFYEVTIHRAITDDTDLIVPNPNPPNNNPPVWDSQPSVTFVFGTASNYDLNDITSDPDSDPITFALNTGSVSLPAGVTWTPGTGILAYDGVGAVTTTMGHIATIDDGTESVNSIAFNIQISQTVTMSNFPNVWAVFALASVNDRLDNQPYKEMIEHCNVLIHQGLNVATAGARANTLARFNTLRAANPNVFIGMHIDILNIIFDQSSNSAERWLEDLLWANPSLFDDVLLRQAANQPFMTHLDGQANGLALKWDCSDAAMQAIVEGQLSQFSDNDGVSNMMPTHALSVMHDTMPERDFSRYRKVEHSGLISSITSSTEINIPAWSDVQTSGGADGNGYISLAAATNFVAVQQNRQQGSRKRITGINAAGTRVRLESALEMSDQAGDDFFIYELSGSSGGSERFGEMDEESRLAGINNFFDRYEATALANYGVGTLKIRNGGGQDGRFKRSGDAPAYPSSWIGQWDLHQIERFGSGTAGFFQYNDTDYRTQSVSGGSTNIKDEDHQGRTYDLDRFMRDIEYGKLMLRSNAASPCGYPCVMINIQAREFSNYDSYTELDASFIRFWCILSWCMENVMPQIEQDRIHDKPIMIDEMCIEAGAPITTRDFGTYDPTGANDTGSLALFSPDFGTHGRIFEFGNALYIVNPRQPDSAVWVPSHLSGGQSIDPALDVATLPSAGSGFKWQHINRNTTINNDVNTPYYLKSPSDFDANARIVGDSILNNGADAGVTVNCGACEAVALMRVAA